MQRKKVSIHFALKHNKPAFLCSNCRLSQQKTGSNINCAECAKPVYKTQSEKMRRVPLFCSQQCAGTYNMRHRSRKQPKIYTCKYCIKEFIPTHLNSKFCSIKCSSVHRGENCNKKFITKLRNNELSGKFIALRLIYKYLVSTIGNKCSLCGLTDTWHSKSIRHRVDHIDGNASNNNLTNFRLVCPNCDSQLDTYGSRNRGKGRTILKRNGSP
jgi:endogenous inhibitor of DNA gyrase (YacG/DUF329 family)